MHLHARHLIYRDLKPENLLVSEQGYLKVCDMGLAKRCTGKSYTTCGTPDYFAPEVVTSSGYNIAVDWWTLGILVFEMLAGRPPFESKTPMSTYRRIVKGIGDVKMPKTCKGAAGEYIKELLHKCPSSRLPMRSGGTRNIKRHQWYAGFDWPAFQARRMAAPYVPKVKNKADASNFGSDDRDLPPVVKYVDDGSGWDDNFATSV